MQMLTLIYRMQMVGIVIIKCYSLLHILHSLGLSSPITGPTLFKVPPEFLTPSMLAPSELHKLWAAASYQEALALSEGHLEGQASLL